MKLNSHVKQFALLFRYVSFQIGDGDINDSEQKGTKHWFPQCVPVPRSYSLPLAAVVPVTIMN
jgi:hypothetical protein